MIKPKAKGEKMKTKVLFIVLLSLIGTAIFAIEDTITPEQKWQKTLELNQLAERFKAETGFRGKMNYNFERMKLGSFEGNFTDIPFSTDADTTSFRQACNRIIDKILPYSYAKRSQLSMSRITKSGRGYTTDYYQQVNGYRVEGLGFIMITYDAGRKHFSIGDNTVDLPDIDVRNKITYGEAEEIVVRDKNDIRYQKAQVKAVFFSKMGSDVYYLAYMVSIGDESNPIFGDFFYYIDSLSGTVKHREAISFIHSDLSVKVLGKDYIESAFWNIPPTYSTDEPMEDVRVIVYPDTAQTNQTGNVNFNDVSDRTITTQLINQYFKVTCGNDTLSAVSHSVAIDDSIQAYTISIPDGSCFAPNVYKEAVKHVSGLQQINGENYFDNFINIFTFQTHPNPTALTYGAYSPRRNLIWIRDGRLSDVVRHELSHHFIHRKIGVEGFNAPDTIHTYTGAMDEAFAKYLSGAPTGNSILPGIGNNWDMALLYSMGAAPTLNEEQYAKYVHGVFLASAWWSLRGNSLFPPDVLKNGVDTLLVGGLGIVREEINQAASYRYKPRYFYNILMSRVGDNNNSMSMNEKQIAIDKAYSDRGFHFTPKVESYSNAQRSRNVFSPGDEVYVNISNAPQNTYFRAYVIRHDSYTYTDGAPVSTLTSHLASDFFPMMGRTDANGTWNGYLWTIPIIIDTVGVANIEGAYDIIVDFGSPNTPDGHIHFAYNGANVRDGFDGLTEPGFKVYDDKIDLVVALDNTGSMDGVADNLQSTARALIGYLKNGDRLNMFKFFTVYDNANYQINRPITLVGTDTNPAEINNNHSSLASDVLISDTNHDTNLNLPFHVGYQRFAPTYRKKGFILFSDGLHNVSHYLDHTIQSRIQDNYLPNKIKCHSMCYITDSGLANISINTMNNIAQWGEGFFYLRSNISDTYSDIESLISSIRKSPPAIDTRGLIGPGNIVNIPFLIDTQAHDIQTFLSFGQDLSTNSVSLKLTSPTGTEYNNYIFWEVMNRLDVDNPEAGSWIATIENTSPDSIQFCFGVDVTSDINAEVSEIPQFHPIDIPFIISVSLNDYITPITGASVSVAISRDSWTKSIILYDDGSNGDLIANDGIYSNYLYIYNDVIGLFSTQEGVYELSFDVLSQSKYVMRSIRRHIYLEDPSEAGYPSVTRNLNRGWNWVGYPRLQRDDVGTSIDYANVSLSPYLTEIQSKTGIAQYQNNHWIYDGLTSLNSNDGYKLKINGITNIRLFEFGTIIDTLMVHQLYEGQWNWLTYPCYETVYPWEALSSVIDKIDYIMAEQWSMKKDGDVWIHDGFSRPHLKYGDSVMIQTTRDCSFIWNSPLTTPPVQPPQKPSHFTFKDKADYETIMIESIEGDPDYLEIGVFQDDVCIGARVYEAYPIQILAYSTPEVEGGGELSFMLYSENKGMMSAIPIAVNPGVINNNTTTIEPEFQGFRSLKLKTGDQQVPVVLALQSNYPNPFNPSTTISFSVPSTAKVKLTIYNIRGQKVKELVNNTMLYGRHTVVWNGRDDGDRSVGSGVYFARLEHKGKVLVQKMMLLK